MSDDESTSVVSTFYHTDSVLGKAALHGKITIKTTFLEPFQLLEQLFETHLSVLHNRRALRKLPLHTSC